MRLRVLVFGATLFVARTASATCSGPLSSTHYCVTHDGFRYSLDDGSGPVEKKIITLEPDVEVAFELDPDSTRFQQHPFYITDSSAGAGAGKHYTTPAMSGTVLFTPSIEHTPLYYQCSIHTFMGSQILVPGADAAPLPAETPDASKPPVFDGGSSSGGVGKDAGAPDAETADAGTTDPTTSTNDSDDGGCSATGTGASAGGFVIAALGLIALRRRRHRARC